MESFHVNCKDRQYIMGQNVFVTFFQSLRLLDMAGEIRRKKTGRSAFHSNFVYKTPIFSANTILSTALN